MFARVNGNTKSKVLLPKGDIILELMQSSIPQLDDPFNNYIKKIILMKSVLDCFFRRGLLED